MMKTKHILFALAAVPSLHACTIEGNVGYFRPSSHIMREVYGNSWGNFGVTATQKLVSGLNLFGGLNLIPGWGDSIAGHESTNIYIFPITLGLEWVQPVHQKIDFYVGGGPRYYLTWIKNDSPYVPQHQFLNGFGGYVMTGARFYPVEHFLIDLDVGYGFGSFGSHHSSDTMNSYSVNVGGLDVTAGVGYRF